MRTTVSMVFVAVYTAFGQPPTPPAFEVASVKLAGPEVPQPWTITGGPGTNDPGRFRAPRISLSYLILRAFGVSADQIIGPEWLHDPFGSTFTTFTVVATMPPGITNEQFRANAPEPDRGAVPPGLPPRDTGFPRLRARGG